MAFWKADYLYLVKFNNQTQDFFYGFSCPFSPQLTLQNKHCHERLFNGLFDHLKEQVVPRFHAKTHKHSGKINAQVSESNKVRLSKVVLESIKKAQLFSAPFHPTRFQ